MPRTLPWLDNDTGKSRSRKARANPNSENARARTFSTAQLVRKDSPLHDLKPLGHRPREPSSSPPPPLPSISSLEPMRSDGHDDCWIMVEDELLSTAQQYTRHLHHAEYKRLKHAAARRNDETLNAIKRPTHGENKHAKRSFHKKDNTKSLREEAQHLVALNGDSTKQANEDYDFVDDDEPDIFIGDRNLASLMLETREQRGGQKPELPSFAGSRSNTRAAAGYQRADHRPTSAGDPKPSQNEQLRQLDAKPIKHTSPEKVQGSTRDSDNADTTSDDDLDAVVHTNKNATQKKVDTVPPKPLTRSYQSPHKPSFSSSRSNESRQYPSEVTLERTDGPFDESDGPIRFEREQKRSKHSGENGKAARAEDPSFDFTISTSVYSWRKARETKRKKAKTTDLDEIPTFLV
ncbi:MAG: hypothetical protein M1831_001627 [Alyxoria varia]|nr:MAG: hypothetical protein M1831_001627 [Alyxoria varia]